ncbi:hypothetical protein Tco_0129305 [Tanacetum coccineum]
MLYIRDDKKYILKKQFESFSVSNSEGLHKGYDRFQSLLSQLEIHGAGVSIEDANQKFLRSLPSSWSQVILDYEDQARVDILEEPKALVTLDGDGVDWTGHVEDEQENFALMAYSNSDSDIEREQLGDASIEIKAYTLALAKMSAKDKSGLGSSDVEDSPVYDRFAKVEGMHAVPPLMTGNYMPPKSDFGIEDHNFFIWSKTI